jgi:hypothetical protein
MGGWLDQSAWMHLHISSKHTAPTENQMILTIVVIFIPPASSSDPAVVAVWHPG